MQLYRSEAAINLLGDYSFQQFWQSVYQCCPWKTCYQHLNYVSAWYQTYSRDFEPLILLSDESPKQFILPLATRSGQIVVAGGRQAEYQAWLAPRLDLDFMYELIDFLNKTTDWKQLTFKFLPAGLSPAALPPEHIVEEEFRRPLLSLNPIENVNGWLKKISKKSKLNELKKEGDLVFKQLTSASELEQYLDNIIEMYDFRQGAVNGVLPFELDPRKKKFCLALADLSSLTHCTILQISEQVIAAHYGRISGDTLHVGILAYSPLYARFSPAKVHLMMLALMLHKQGIRFIDLTPGGDEWKERFATEHDTVTLATLYRSRLTARKLNLERSARKIAKRTLVSLGFSSTLLSKLAGDRNGNRRELSADKGATEPSSSTAILYSATTADLDRVGEDQTEVCMDRMSHLLSFERGQNQDGRLHFLAKCLRRLELGQSHVFTRVEKGSLVQSVWLTKHLSSVESLEPVASNLSAESKFALFDLRCDCDFQDEKSLRILVAPILDTLVRDSNGSSIFLYVPSNEPMLVKTVESLGLKPLKAQ